MIVGGEKVLLDYLFACQPINPVTHTRGEGRGREELGGGGSGKDSPHFSLQKLSEETKETITYTPWRYQGRLLTCSSLQDA